MNKQIILGTLLGDAWIQKVNYRKNSYIFAYQQSIKEYAEWKALEIGLPFSIKTYQRYDKRTKKEYNITHVHLVLNSEIKQELYNLFYTDKKQVSQEVLDQLDDEAVCIWFLDDGNMYYNGNNCHINMAINGFNDESKERIIVWFKEKYNLNFKRTGKSIRITSKRECKIFMDIVEKYIPECMKYKKLSEAEKKHELNLNETKLKMRKSKLDLYERRK